MSPTLPLTGIRWPERSTNTTFTTSPGCSGPPVSSSPAEREQTLIQQRSVWGDWGGVRGTVPLEWMWTPRVKGGKLVAQLAGGKAQGHLRSTGPAGGWAQSLSSWSAGFWHWAERRPAPGIWPGVGRQNSRIHLQQGSDSRGSGRWAQCPTPTDRQQGIGRESPSLHRGPGRRGWWGWFAKMKALPFYCPQGGDPR